MNGCYSKPIMHIYLIFCHIYLKITTLENPLTNKILNVRDNQDKTSSLQIVQIDTITPGGNPYIRLQRLW